MHEQVINHLRGYIEYLKKDGLEKTIAEVEDAILRLQSEGAAKSAEVNEANTKSAG